MSSWSLDELALAVDELLTTLGPAGAAASRAVGDLRGFLGAGFGGCGAGFDAGCVGFGAGDVGFGADGAGAAVGSDGT
jgi:hypothetical protein